MESLRRAWRKLDTAPIEWVYAALTICWGGALLWPGDAFSRSPSFGPMAYVMREEFWGVLALCIGSTRIYGLVREVHVARMLAAMGGGLIWTFVWVSMLMAGGVSTGPALYGVLSTANLIVFIKLFRTLPTTEVSAVGES